MQVTDAIDMCVCAPGAHQQAAQPRKAQCFLQAVKNVVAEAESLDASLRCEDADASIKELARLQQSLADIVTITSKAPSLT